MSLRIAATIENAIARGHPVVALESTVVTHGLPRPRNLELALELEAIVREEGAEPATIAVLNGELTVGLDSGELEGLATEANEKATLWNLASLCARGSDAGTTVATTLHAAGLAGIRVFATGGIGGVHPQPFDESADLTALSNSPVITVCSGPKSILLAGATLERLETLGVPVVGYRSAKLAGFHVAETEFPLPARSDSVEEIAAIFRKHRSLKLRGGLLVSNPVSRGLGHDELLRLREEAESEAARAGVTGKDLTPFLLSRLAELSEGRTVEVNLRLLRENARLAARIAVAFSGGNGDGGSGESDSRDSGSGDSYSRSTS